MRFSIVSLFFLVIATAVLFAQESTEDWRARLDGIEHDLNVVLDSFQVPGFAVSVVVKDQVIYTKGFGFRDLENKIPVDEHTLFAIGSCSKAFTTSLLGILRDQGEVAFDESPRKYCSDLTFFNDEMNSGIVLKDLICHTTGLPRHDFSWYLNPTDSKKDLIKRVAHQEPFARVRQNWYYNNFMYLAQGVIVEEVTGKSWEDNVAEQLFTPLQMTRSNLSIDDMKKSDNAALGYELKDGDKVNKMDYYDIAGMSPAGSINSSVSEMANWVLTWINGGIFKGDTVLPASFVRDAISGQSVIGGALPGEEHPDLHFSNYGFGWFLSSYKGHYRVQHGGNIDGFSANTCFFPSDSVGIVVLCNQNGSSVPSVVRNLMADRILDLEISDWIGEIKRDRDKAIKNQQEARKASTANRVPGTKPSHLLPEYAGEYSHQGYGTFSLVERNDSLFAEFPVKKFWLRHFHYDVFEPFEITKNGIDTTTAPPGMDLRLNFKTDNNGEITGTLIKVEPMVDAVEFKRKPSEIKVDRNTLGRYVGEYEFSGIIAKVYLKGADHDGLYLFVQGQPEYELYAIAANTFAIKNLEGYKLSFKEDENQGISSVLMIQPNGTFEAMRK